MKFHLAQLNIGRLLYPVDDPRIADFKNALDQINALAEASPGFVWRLQSVEGNATQIAHPWSSDPLMLVNMSVWTDPDSLKAYAYKTTHVDFFRRRREWFEPATQAHAVLWWIPSGHIPSLEEAAERLRHLRTDGPTPQAYWFNQLFPEP